MNMKKDTLNIYTIYFEKYILENKDIDPILFFTEIIDIIDISIGKKEMTKNNIFIGNKIIKNNNIMQSICDFLNSVCKNVFLKLGYKDYFNNIWIMKI